MKDTRIKHLQAMSDEEKLDFLKDNFELELRYDSLIVSLDELDPNSSYFWSDIWVIDQRYLVKEILSPAINANPDSFGAKKDLLLHLRKDGIPVFLPHFAKCGNPYEKISVVENEQPHLIEITDYYPKAEKYSESLDQLDQVGDVVGKIVSSLSTIPREIANVILSRETIWQGFRNPLNGLDFAEELSFYQQEVSKLGGELGAQIKTLLPIIREEYERFTSNPAIDIPRGLTHGDIQRCNMIFDKDSKDLVAVIDWDSMEENYKILDIVYTMDRMSFVVPDYHNTDPRKAERFLHSVSNNYTLSSKEEKSMITALVDYSLPNICGIFRDIFYNGFTHPDYSLHLNVLNLNRMRILEKELLN
jgi:Ser/Thr protein kinase RdoA (MazF antagonist)